jgi:hypothetical protein
MLLWRRIPIRVSVPSASSSNLRALWRPPGGAINQREFPRDREIGARLVGAEGPCFDA